MPEILHRIGINARPERVFAALSTVDGLRGWWVSTAVGSGGAIDLGFCTMQVVDASKDALVPWRCVGGPLRPLQTRRLEGAVSLKELVETGAGRPAPHDLKIHVGD